MIHDTESCRELQLAGRSRRIPNLDLAGVRRTRLALYDIVKKEMATAPNKTASVSKSSQQVSVYLPLIAGWLVPGAGHFLLRKWWRGALLFASIVCMFALGMAMGGKLYSGVQDVLDLLGMLGDLGNGLMFLISHFLGIGAQHVRVTTADYGTKFIVVAGLLNVIAAVDAHNLRTGRKA